MTLDNGSNAGIKQPRMNQPGTFYYMIEFTDDTNYVGKVKRVCGVLTIKTIQALYYRAYESKNIYEDLLVRSVSKPLKHEYFLI